MAHAGSGILPLSPWRPAARVTHSAGMSSPTTPNGREAVDAYVEAAPAFAQPILRHFRAWLHEQLPGVQESIKWRMPFFIHEGKNMAFMAAFKAHVGIGFWQGPGAASTPGPGTPPQTGTGGASGMGQLGKLSSMDDLPSSEALRRLLDQTLALHAAPPAAKAKRPPPTLPDDLAAALKDAPEAWAHYQRLAPTHQREYVNWIEEAKRPATRQERVAKTLHMLKEGRKRDGSAIRGGPAA